MQKIWPVLGFFEKGWARVTLVFGIASVCTGLAVYWASLTAFIKIFAPLSYMIVGLVVALLLAMIFALIAWGWRRVYPIPIPTPLTHDDVKMLVNEYNIEQRIMSLDERMVAQTGATGQLVEQIERLSASLAKLDQKVGPVIFASDRELAYNLAITLQNLVHPKPETNNPRGFLPRRTGGQISIVATKMEMLGITQQQRAEAHEAARQAIMADSVFLTLQDGEDQHWRRWEDKRDWYLDNAPFEADLQILRERNLIDGG